MGFSLVFTRIRELSQYLDDLPNVEYVYFKHIMNQNCPERFQINDASSDTKSPFFFVLFCFVVFCFQI